MGNEGVHRKEHLRCGARLDRLPILEQAEGQVLDVAPQLLEGNERPGHHRRTVERLGLSQGLPEALSVDWTSRAVKSRPSPTVV